jgi:hypothetical protein
MNRLILISHRGWGTEMTMKTTKSCIDMDKLKKAFDSIKDEFSEHLDAINGNTSEIRDTHEYVCELDSKIEKLTEKIDNISFFLNELKSQKDLIVSLSPHEQKVFLVLYLEHSPLPFFELVKRTQLPDAMVERILKSLVDNNIPVISQKIQGTELFALDPKFKEKQARENIIKIDEAVTKSLFVKDLNSFM